MDINDLGISSVASALETEDKLKKSSTSQSSTLQRSFIAQDPRQTKVSDKLHKLQMQMAHQKNLQDNPVIEISQSLQKQVREFEAQLNPDQEIMIMAASFGGQITFYVNSIEFSNPNIIIFHGVTESDKPTRLIQHCSQLSFLLKAVEKHNHEEARKPIGFIHN